MKTMTKRMIRCGLVAASLMALAPVGTAVAGEWRINARECPDLREDRRDARRDNGWNDRREDRRDERVIRCPARAWYYVRDRGERRGWTPPRPRDVIVYRDYRNGRDYAERDYYYRNDRGSLIRLGVDINLRG
ncbi:MAG: hypothetical protein Q8R02_20415 [Hyphomonadaceae bacterium]|nr:hypothetical protein [Hyphomonadaceae bacterium]